MIKQRTLAKTKERDQLLPIVSADEISNITWSSLTDEYAKRK